MIEQERLRELLEYDPDEKTFRWKVDRKAVKAGDIAGSLRKANGRPRIFVDGCVYSPERLAHFYLHGEWLGKKGQVGRPTQSLLKRMLNYDPETGEFIWLLITNRTDRIGEVAGAVNPETRYRLISIGGRNYPAHVLAFVYMTGRWPVAMIDHEDGCRSNNSWKNLREATRSQNLANSKRRKDNTTGFKGVWKCRDDKFRARIAVGGKAIHLGYFTTPEKAHDAYCKAASEHFGEFARAA